MAGQRGFLYEGRVFNKLKSKNLVPFGVKPAGPDPSKPDAVFLYDKVPHNLEVKLDLATDFGQGTLEYKDGAWSLGGADTPAAEEMRNIFIYDIINFSQILKAIFISFVYFVISFLTVLIS